MKNYKISYKEKLGVVYSCKYRVVWCVKYLRPVLLDDVSVRLHEIIRSVAAECDLEIMGVKIWPDHVSLLIEIDPQMGIHKIIKLIKNRSSGLIRSEFDAIKTRVPTLWTNNYFVTTEGYVSDEVVSQFIEQQKHV